MMLFDFNAFICILICACWHLPTGECLSFTTHKDTYYEGTVVKTGTAESNIHCSVLCNEDSRCASANFHSATKACELLGVEENHGSAEHREGWTLLCCFCEGAVDGGPVQDGLVGFWPFTEPNGGNDLSGHGNHASLHNVTFSMTSCQQGLHALEFKGTTQSYVKINASVSLDVQSDFTWMAWVYLHALQEGPLFDYYSDTDVNCMGLHVWVHPADTFFWGSGLGIGAYHSYGTALETGKWNRLSMAYESNTGRLGMYVNGVETWNENLAWINLTMETNKDIYIGARKMCSNDFDSRALWAKMACVRLYNKVVPLAEVDSAVPACGHLP